MSRHTHHNCAVSSCGLIITSDLLMCKEHWNMVPKPMQQAVTKTWRQGGAAAYLAARAAAVKAVQDGLRRAKTAVTIATIALALLAQGCMVIGYKNPDGSKFIAITCIADDKIAKLAVDHTTKATSTGLAIGAIDHQVDDEAFKAAVSGAVEGTLKALGFVL